MRLPWPWVNSPATEISNLYLSRTAWFSFSTAGKSLSFGSPGTQ